MIDKHFWKIMCCVLLLMFLLAEVRVHIQNKHIKLLTVMEKEDRGMIDTCFSEIAEWQKIAWSYKDSCRKLRKELKK